MGSTHNYCTSKNPFAGLPSLQTIAPSAENLPPGFECTSRLGVIKRQEQFRMETRCFRFSRD